MLHILLLLIALGVGFLVYQKFVLNAGNSEDSTPPSGGDKYDKKASTVKKSNASTSSTATAVVARTPASKKTPHAPKVIEMNIGGDDATPSSGEVKEVNVVPVATPASEPGKPSSSSQLGSDVTQNDSNVSPHSTPVATAVSAPEAPAGQAPPESSLDDKLSETIKIGDSTMPAALVTARAESLASTPLPVVVSSAVPTGVGTAFGTIEEKRPSEDIVLPEAALASATVQPTSDGGDKSTKEKSEEGKDKVNSKDGKKKKKKSKSKSKKKRDKGSKVEGNEKKKKKSKKGTKSDKKKSKSKSKKETPGDGASGTEE